MHHVSCNDGDDDDDDDDDDDVFDIFSTSLESHARVRRLRERELSFEGFLNIRAVSKELRSESSSKGLRSVEVLLGAFIEFASRAF